MQRRVSSIGPQRNNSNKPKISRRKKDKANTTINEDDGPNITVCNDEEDVPRQKKPAEISLENFGLSVARKKLEGLKKEFEELQAFKPVDVSANAFNLHRDKNRYFNIPCYDRSRVMLSYHVPPDHDYIHANYITSSFVKLNQKYICTQGPTDVTVPDFWRMIWQEKVRFIVMLCSTVENGKPKCSQYYPMVQDESKAYGTINVTNKKSLTPPNEKIFESTLFEVFSAMDVQEPPLHLILMRWLYWPDFSVPQSGMGMLRILKTIRDTPNGTAVLHCSAGIGRTGTLMACEICLRIMLEGKELNVPEVVKELRSQRSGAIQTESQYIYLHRALCEYVHAKRLLKDDLTKFFAEYAAYLKTLIKPVTANLPTIEIPAPNLGSPLPTVQQLPRKQ